MSKEQDLGQKIFEEVGGMGNVSKIAHCMTRVRLGIKDTDKVNVEA